MDQANLINIYKSCLNILRDEGLTGETALRNMSYLLILKLIEPRLGNEIDIDNFDYDFSHIVDENIDYHKNKLLSLVRFSNLVNEKENNIQHNMNFLWQDILACHPVTKNIFLKDKGFDIKHQSTFKKLINKINTIDSTTAFDILGNAYEEVIQDIMTGKVLGQFFTQPSIKKMMVKLINPQIHPDGKIDTCCDPTMGTGGFLITYLRHILKQAKNKNIELDWNFIKTYGLYGKEIDPATFQLAISNMLISSGHMFEYFENGDSIREPINKKFDNILANPPFGIKGLKYDSFISPIKNEYIPIKTDNAVSLFIQAIIYMLNINGKCAVVLPDGKDLFNKNKTLIDIRKYLMKTCDLKEIYCLPSKTFTYTNINTCIFYFVKKREGKNVVATKIKLSRAQKETGREYKFSNIHQTKSIKFYNYDPIENSKELLADVPIEKIVENSYSLKYTDYLTEIQERNNYNNDIIVKTIDEIFKCKMGRFNSNDMDNIGNIPFYSCKSNNPVGFHSIPSFDSPEYLLLVTAGGSINNIIGDDVGLGKCYYVNGKTACRANVCSLIPKDQNICIKYIFYYLNLNRIKTNKMAHFTTNLGTISLENIKSIKIPIPSLERQKKAVEDLDHYETSNKISRDKIIALKKDNEIILKNQINYGDNEVKKLGELCEFIKTGKNKPKDNKTGSLFPYYGTGAITGYTDEYLYDGNYILTARNGTIGNCFLTEGKFFPSDHIFVIDIQDKYLMKYVFYILSNNEKLNSLKTGVGIPNITKGVLENFIIPVPPIERLKEIIEYCEENDKSIQNMERSIERNKKQAQIYMSSIGKSKNIAQHNQDSNDDDEMAIYEQDIYDAATNEEQNDQTKIKKKSKKLNKNTSSIEENTDEDNKDHDDEKQIDQIFEIKKKSNKIKKLSLTT